MENEGVEELLLGRIELMKIMVSHVAPLVLNAVVRLQIPDIIATQGEHALLSAEQILNHIPGASPKRVDVVARMLRFLAGKKVFREVEDPDNNQLLYGLNSLSRWLVQDKETGFNSSAALLSFHTQENCLASWQQMHRYVLQENDEATPFQLANGDSFYKFVSGSPELSQIFNDAMVGLSSFSMPTIAKQYGGFDNTKNLVDVGGGLGVFIGALVKANPGIQGINFDLPHVISHALEFPGVTNIAGNMFEGVPEGDTIIMKAVLHNWDDQKCDVILRNCYKALPLKGKLVVIDYLYNQGSCYVPELDMAMLTGSAGGRERNKKEWTALLNTAGFSCIDFITNMPILEVVIQAYKVE